MEMYLLMHDVENKNIFFTMILGLEKMESDAFDRTFYGTFDRI